MPTMLASVIVRTMGRPSLLDALSSIADQGRDDIDVIVVDARGDLAKPVTALLPIRWLSQGCHLPRSTAAQLGLAAVLTRWAIFLDDDDVLLPGHLDKLMAALAGAPGAVLAHTGVEIVRGQSGARTSSVVDEAFEPWELLLGNRMPIHAVLFDATLVRASGITFDKSFELYEDWDFWLQLSQLGRFVHVPGVSARYLIGEASSDVHRVAHGDAAYFKLWHKWWTLAPSAWWAQALHAGERLPAVQRELRGALAQSADLLGHLQSTRDTLVQSQQQAAQWAADVTQLHGLLGEQVRHATQMSTERQQAEDELARTQLMLATEQHALASTQDMLARTQVVLATTQDTLATTHDTLATTHHALTSTQGTLAATRIERQRTADALQTMLQSSSWRITQPLRDAMDRLRLLRQRLGSFRRQSTWRAWPQRRDGYARWIATVEAADIAARQSVLAARAQGDGPRVSVLMPVFNPGLSQIDAAIESLRAQSWPHWELCVADDASTAPGVREHLRDWAARESRLRVVERASNGHISAASNSALELASGEWVTLLDQDDVLAPNALAELADAALCNPRVALIYSDEDKLDGSGRRFEPHFKPAFSVELLRGQNFINHLVAYRRSLMMDIVGFREGFEGAQDHDLALRATERLAPAQIVHIPRVLYHWRAGAGSTAASSQGKPYALAAALRAVQDSLSRCEPLAQVELLPALGYLRVRYPLPQAMPVIAKANDGDERINASALVLLCREGLQGEGGWLDELVAQVSRPGVGVAAGCITRDGLLVEGALTIDADGQARVAYLGSDPTRGGHFGRHALTQAVEAVTPSCMLMRRELWPLWQRQPEAVSFGTAVKHAGWRLVWTPFARLDDPAR